MNAAPEQQQTNGESRSLATQLEERGVSKAAWHTLSQSLFPGARQGSVLLVIDYCKSRGLDPLKKPCHIVPMEIRNAQTGNYEWRDVVMPGIYELRTTAQRTGEYLGHSKPEYGPDAECKGVNAPEWCSFTVYRWNTKAGVKAEYPVKVYFTESVGTKKNGAVNSRWSKAPHQMLTKCAEAAGLREAFPDELGGEMSAEEMGGQHTTVIDAECAPVDDDDAAALNRELDLQAKEEESELMPTGDES